MNQFILRLGDPGMAGAWYNRGLALKRMGKIEEACADWREASGPSSPDAEEILNQFCLN